MMVNDGIKDHIFNYTDSRQAKNQRDSKIDIGVGQK